MRRSVLGAMCMRWSNPEAARLCSIRVGWTTFLVYLIAGLCFGLVGLLAITRVAGRPRAYGMELDVIIAAVIGGASLSGGAGTSSTH